MAAEADRLQTKIRELGSDALDLPIRCRIRIDMLEPTLDCSDLARVISGLGKTFQRLIDRVRREDDCRTENRALHQDSFPHASTGHMARGPDDAQRSRERMASLAQQNPLSRHTGRGD